MPSSTQCGAGEEDIPAFSREFLPDADSEAEALASRQRILAAIERLGLERQVAELETDGFTVLSPHLVATPGFVEALRERVLSVAQQRFAQRIDFAAGTSHELLSSPFGQVQFEPCLLEEGEIFEQALMNERSLTLISYLLGESCVLCHMSGMVKGPGKEYLPLHADQNQNSGPPPFPPYAQVANATWLLTDYTADNGAICFVAGSHKLLRPPTHDEATDLSRFSPVEAPAGSVIIWHGNTWHGALRRTNPGLRVSLVCYFNRWYHYPFEELSSRITEEMLNRNVPRFAVLTGVRHPAHEHPLSSKARAMRTGLFA